MNVQSSESLSYAHTCAVFLAGANTYLAQLADDGKVKRYIRIVNSDLPLTDRQIAVVFANIREGDNNTSVDYYCNEVTSFTVPIFMIGKPRLERILKVLWQQTIDQPLLN